MTEDPIPDDIKKFVVENIDSVAQLEALLLLRNNSDEQWSVQAIAKRLYINEQETMPLLARLGAAGLILSTYDKPPLYIYQPGSTDLVRLVDRLAETYSRHLVPITNLIHSKPRTRIQEFADAFKLRKEE